LISACLADLVNDLLAWEFLQIPPSLSVSGANVIPTNRTGFLKLLWHLRTPAFKILIEGRISWRTVLKQPFAFNDSKSGVNTVEDDIQL
jgi:hypothetical protein